MPGSPRPNLKLEALEARDVPAVFGVADSYDAQNSTLFQVDRVTGVLANDFSDSNPGNVLAARRVGLPQFVTVSVAGITSPINPNGGGRPFPPLLNNSLQLNADGSFSLQIPASLPAGADAIRFTYIASDPQTTQESAPTEVIVRLRNQSQRLVAIAPDAGGTPEVRVYRAGTSELANTFTPYESSYTGGVRVAVGDINGDGVDDIAAIPESGGSDRLRIFNGVDGSTLVDQFVFSAVDTNYRGGGYVALGDVNGDGRKDIIVGAGEGGGPRVRVLVYNTQTGGTGVLADFFAYGSDVRSGVRVAAGRLSATSPTDSVITSPGVGGGRRSTSTTGRVSAARGSSPRL